MSFLTSLLKVFLGIFLQETIELAKREDTVEDAETELDTLLSEPVDLSGFDGLLNSD